MTKRKHRHFEIITPSGQSAMVHGDPNMSQETCEALGRMLDLAADQFIGVAKMEKWNPVAPGFEPFWGIVSQTGKVIALRLASEDIAKQICDEHNNANQNDVSSNLCAKCEKPMVISHVCVNTDCDRCGQ